MGRKYVQKRGDIRNIDMLYELTKIETENSGMKKLEQISWAEVRKKIQEKMVKTVSR